MAIALVGSLGTPVTGTTSVSPTFGQATTAGNLLICWLIGAPNGYTLPSGWSQAASSFDGQTSLVLYKANCGASETAPSFTTATNTFMAAALGEFSGAATTSPVDQNKG